MEERGCGFEKDGGGRVTEGGGWKRVAQVEERLGSVGEAVECGGLHGGKRMGEGRVRTRAETRVKVDIFNNTTEEVNSTLRSLPSLHLQPLPHPTLTLRKCFTRRGAWGGGHEKTSKEV
jgi:hypothetical protein